MMMMFRGSSLPLCLVLLVTILALQLPVSLSTDPAEVNGGDSSSSCQCQFDVVPDDETTCKVYGLLGQNSTNGQDLVAWDRAAPKCLSEINVSLRNMTYTNQVGACPDRNGTNSTALFITNLWRQDSYLARKTLNESNAGKIFFNLTDDGPYILKNTIVARDGKDFDCTTLSMNQCWQEVVLYLSAFEESVVTDDKEFDRNARGGPQDVARICNIIHDVELQNSLMEQSMARRRLCRAVSANNVSLVTSIQCENLIEQIGEEKNRTGILNCKKYGRRAPEERIPTECDEVEEEEEETKSGAGSSLLMMLSTATSAVIFATTVLFF